MFSVRWRKVLRDLWFNELRTILAVMAIAIGIFGVGSILSAYAILTREINVNFMGTSPASAILYVDKADTNLAKAVESLPGITAAEPRRTISARMLIGPNEWRPLLLYVIDDFSSMRVATFTSDKGKWPPADNELLIERSSLTDSKVGDVVTIRTPNGQNRELPVTGIVHDAAQAPGWQDRVVYGYVTLNTLTWLGETPTFDELRILVSQNALDVPHITDVAYQVKNFVQQQGHIVSAVSIPKPGEHPHTDQMNSLLYLFEAFGILALLLSGILVANIITALLAQQIRQIGVMKALGASTRQIAGLYFGTVMIFGITALLIGIPLGQWAGRLYAAFTAAFLNFDITSNYIPLWVYAVQIFVGLAVPLIAAAFPVFKGSQITVQQAINDYGIGNAQFGTTFIDALIIRIRGLSRPLLLSLRNTFRRRARLILTLGILAVGGAAFMSAINVGVSWYNTIDQSFQYRHYDMEVRFTQPYPTAQVANLVQGIPGVVKAENWEQLLTVRQRADGTDGIRFNVTGLPASSTMISFPVIEGRWLQPGDTNAIVVNHELNLSPDWNVKVGDTVKLKFGDITSEWTVVGVVLEVGAPRRGLGTAASAYVPLDYLTQVTHTGDMTSNVRIATAEHGNDFVAGISQKLEQQFDTAGMQRTTIQLTTERKRVLQEHLIVIVAVLMVMAILVAAVGGLALASTMSISVLERTRELGIMRAIGASTGVVLRIVITEGIVIGLLSWLAALAVAIPLSMVIGNAAGQIFISTNLNYNFPPAAMLGWFGLIFLISIVASFYPAWSAAQLTVREVLAYE
ncbi:MAG: FtsX-like permease family protein [Chloroflexota bacterium]